MQRIRQWDQTLERFADRFNKQLLPHGPAELFKIERPHIHFPLLGGDDDIRHVPLDGDQRTSFHIVIPAIRNQIFDEFPRRRIPLNLIENNQRFPLIQSRTVIRRQQHEKCVKVVTLVFEDVANVTRQTREIDENIRLVLSAAEFFGNGAFAHTASTFNEKRLTPARFLLPCDQLIQHFALQHEQSPHYTKTTV